MKFVYYSTGRYLGFIEENGNLFSRDGVYLGWVDGNFVWGADGQFRGELSQRNGDHYVLRNAYTIPPIPKTPRIPSPAPAIPNSPPNIASINLPIELRDAF